MLYWRYSPNRIFFLDEYWILIPSALVCDFFIIRQIIKYKKRKEELRKYQEELRQFEEALKKRKIGIEVLGRNKRLLRIVSLALGVSSVSYLYLLKLRGGQKNLDVFNNLYYMNLHKINNCDIEEGLRFVDQKRLKKLIHLKFPNKKFGKGTGKIIYITATELCHIVRKYGSELPFDLPVVLPDLGYTSLRDLVIKTIATLIASLALPVLFIWESVVGLGVATLLLTLLTYGLRIGITNQSTRVLTSAISSGGKMLSKHYLKPRIADVNEVVSVNLKNQLATPAVSIKDGECWLPLQKFLNSKCKFRSTLTDTILHDLTYDDVVNLVDTTNLDGLGFDMILGDVLDLGQPQTIAGR